MKKMIYQFLAVIMSFTALQQQAFGEIPKEELFASARLSSAKISPDGNTIAYVGADQNGISNVFIGPRNGTLESSEQVTFFKTPKIIRFFLSGDSNRVLLLKDEDGKGQYNLHGININTKEHVIYTQQFPNVNAKVIQIGEKNTAVIGLNNRNRSFHDLYLLNLDSGEFTLLLENDHYAKFLVSENLDPILKVQINDDGSWTIWTFDDEVFMQLTPEDVFQTELLYYNEKKKSVYLLDNRFSDTNQLTVKSLSGDEKVLGSQPDSDVDDVLFLDGEAKAYASYYTEKKWHVIDHSVQEDVEFLEKNIGRNFEVLSKNRNEDLWIVSNNIPDQGSLFYCYERTTKRISPLHSSKSKYTFSKMYPTVVEARDGKKLVCYYTLPKELDKGGYVDQPIPLVVYPHGGPFKARDKFRFNPYHQWLANCGYAVLSVNFRLSSGFGKEFVNAGNGEWGGKAHLDVIDAVDACIAKRITEKGKLAVYGTSYAGYESLASLIFSPDYFTCCVAICVPSYLKTVLENVPKFWELTEKPLSDKISFFTLQAFITSMGGSPYDPKGIEYLEKCSLLNYVDRIQGSLLLVHGKNDYIVTEKVSQQIYDSMKNMNKEITYILFPDEGHGCAKLPNELLLLDNAELFFSKHLGGKYHPVNPNILEKSSGQIFN